MYMINRWLEGDFFFCTDSTIIINTKWGEELGICKGAVWATSWEFGACLTVCTKHTPYVSMLGNVENWPYFSKEKNGLDCTKKNYVWTTGLFEANDSH